MGMLINVRVNRILLLIIALQSISVAWARDISELSTIADKPVVVLPKYASVFEKYHLYSIEEIGSWRQANDAFINNEKKSIHQKV